VNIEPARDIIVEQFVPHRPEHLWATLTDPVLIERWLMPNSFVPELGARFTFKTASRGDWDGTVDCEVTEYDPPRRLAYSWVGGAANERLDSVVTWTLTPVDGGTMLRMVHAGFRTPENDMAHHFMAPGWERILARVRELTGEA
jgi:uncharacterized protein YndB with AHSA1/START domain